MSKVRRLLTIAWKTSRKLFLIRIGQNLFEALIPMADILGIGVIIDALITGQSRERVFAIITGYVLLHTGISLTRDMFTWLKDKEERKATNLVQYRYARESLEVDYPFIQTGGFLDLKRKSMKVMPAFYIKIFGNSVSYMVKFLGIFSIFTIIHPLLLLCLLLLQVPVVWMSFRQKKEEYQYKQNITVEERKSNYLYKVMTDYSYAKDIRIYDGEGLVSRKYRENAESQIRKLHRLGRKRAGIQSASYLFYSLQLLCMLAAFSYMVYKKEISIAEYTVLLSSSMLFVSIVEGFFGNIAELKEMCRCISIMDEYDSFISDNSRVYRSQNTQNTQNAGKSRDSGPVSIEFEHVTFRYPGKEEMALEDISFRIAPGEKVSFVGVNGAGKTTVIKLLLRMYEPSSGCIKVNGTDIRELPSNRYYERIGVVLQDFFIYAYSVRENLCFDRKAEEPELEEAMEKSGILERIGKLPRGIDTCLYRNLDPEGVELSGGEGQKLAMARALCKDTGLLILDEPSSALDPLAEYDLFTRMSRISENNTTIMISHRLSSTKYSDRILVFQEGRLLQSGSHRELMTREGIYKNMYETQAKYYTGEGGLYEE